MNDLCAGCSEPARCGVERGTDCPGWPSDDELRGRCPECGSLRTLLWAGSKCSNPECAWTEPCL